MRKALAEQRYDEVKTLSEQYAIIDPQSGLADFFVNLARIRQDTITERSELGGLVLAQYGSERMQASASAPAAGAAAVAAAAGGATATPVEIAQAGPTPSAGAPVIVQTPTIESGSTAQATPQAIAATPVSAIATPAVGTVAPVAPVTTPAPAVVPAVAPVVAPAVAPVQPAKPAWQAFLIPGLIVLAVLALLAFLMKMMRGRRAARVHAVEDVQAVPPVAVAAAANGPAEDDLETLTPDVAPVFQEETQPSVQSIEPQDVLFAPDSRPSDSAFEFGSSDIELTPVPTSQFPVETQSQDPFAPGSGGLDVSQTLKFDEPSRDEEAPEATVEGLLNFIPIEPVGDSASQDSGIDIGNVDTHPEIPSREDLMGGLRFEDLVAAPPSQGSSLTEGTSRGESAFSLNDFDSIADHSNLGDESGGGLSFDDVLINKPARSGSDESVSALDLDNIEFPSRPITNADDSYISDYDEVSEMGSDLEQTKGFQEHFENLMFSAPPPPPPMPDDTLKSTEGAGSELDATQRTWRSPEDTHPSDLGLDMDPVGQADTQKDPTADTGGYELPPTFELETEEEKSPPPPEK